MKEYIQLFWNWLYESYQITQEEYALHGLKQNANQFEDAFEHFDDMIASCTAAIVRQQFDDDTIEDIITIMAFDNEAERILDDLAARLTLHQVLRFAEIGLHHKLSEARWQVVVLLCRRKPEGYMELLRRFEKDPDAYVRQRCWAEQQI